MIHILHKGNNFEMKHLIKSAINAFLGPLGAEIIPKRKYLGENYLTTVKERDIFNTVKLETLKNYDQLPRNANRLLQYFIESKDGKLHKWYHYFEFYDRYFQQYANKPEAKILEIGVFRGESLKLWRHYFHKSATIVGIDINPECKKFENTADNIHVRIGPQQDQDFLKKLTTEFGPFDIIIDDGSHISEHMIGTFHFLYPHALKPDGVYLVEDTHTNYEERGAGVADELTFMGFAKNLVDYINEPYTQYFDLGVFDLNNPKKIETMNTTQFYATTKSISFMDSIVVFEKRAKAFIPGHQIR